MRVVGGVVRGPPGRAAVGRIRIAGRGEAREVRGHRVGERGLRRDRREPRHAGRPEHEEEIEAVRRAERTRRPVSRTWLK